MKISLAIGMMLMILGWHASAAQANPALLPRHPGYPMGTAVDPVGGQSLANDPGHTNASGEQAIAGGAASSDRHVLQKLSNDEANRRILDRPGAGLLPKVQGPNIKIEPPVKEATRAAPAP